ncbi:MAG TPA: zinc-dependent alcohol dehydrogenase family protein [Deltaproteobacteria bacterium]|jgi:propanol-preferring alcohol dehydrogenase|nr:zinc-dependent alcohol dehydrogenase family protein [Deltaproteobacteria bacterium]HQI00768.1 zinc-dependent alcohol dehydrogenase family protein [Deltaproteobacteria bacterium]HQJ08831.1 zinc-dependent alcohol dehydrogenase family protein [Deltaproteobacteria bacterium]
MKAMVLDRVVDLKTTDKPLRLAELPEPEVQEGEVLLRVKACGVCHTELDEIEGRTPPGRFPVVPGHQVVGEVAARGRRAKRFREGDRLGVGWIFSACGKCRFCLSGQENLCSEFKATGRDADGGYAEYMKVREDFAYPIPDAFSDSEAAPLLCAGAIGLRSLRLSGIKDGQNLGLTGFGASAHLVLMTVRYRFPRASVFVFARSEAEREFAMELGADWAGDTGEESPEKLHAIIDTTPVWKPVVDALSNLERGGRLVINAIRKEDIDKEYLTRIDYPAQLWMEKEIKSVANVTRQDISEFLEIAAEIPIRPEVQEYPLVEANTALLELKQRKIRGAKVLELG